MIKTLIVDDEPLARVLLETYLKKMPGFSIEGLCQNALEAFSIISKGDIDLVLLDINMPEITGMELLRSLKNPPKIIFTTAYAEYAIQSYEVNAVDYLLKPITFERFTQAIHKLSNDEVRIQPQPFQDTNAKEPILFVKSEGKMIKIDLEQLWIVEGCKNYVLLWVGDKKIIVHSTMQKIEEELKRFSFFIRISKSAIINLKFVNEVEANCIRIRGESLVIGNIYKQGFSKLFEKYKFL
jgi:DNA-binding LytR/AlgR family response regulator